jgi:hypothetical protein
METSSGRFKLTVNCQGTELQGNCSCGKNSMIIFLDSPRFFNRIVLSATVALSAELTTAEAEKRVEGLLAELYTDYHLLVMHKKDLRAALAKFDKDRDALVAQNREDETNTLLSDMIQDIIGKKCCIDDLEEVAEKIAFELD